MNLMSPMYQGNLKEVTGKFWKFIRCFIPMFLLTGLQIACSFAATFVCSLSYTIEHPEDIEGATAYAKNLATDSHFLMKIMIVYDIIGLIAFGIFYFTHVREKGKKSGASFSKFSIPVIVILFAGMETFIACLLNVIGALFPGLLDQYVKRIETMGLTEMTFLSGLVAIVFTPVLEEIVYRAISFYYIEKFTDMFWFANIMQAAIFGMGHLNLVQGIYAFFMGLVMGYLYKKYQSLWASILGHVAFNITGTVLVPVIFGSEEMIPMNRVMVITVISLVVLVIAIMALRKDKAHSINGLNI